MLVEVVEKIAEETREDRQPYRHRPSAVGQCIRAMVYHAIGIEPRPLPGRAVLVFDDSSWHEELSADWIRKSVYELHSEQMKVEIFNIKDQVIYGYIDGILMSHLTFQSTSPEAGEMLWEHKALNHFSFERILKNPEEAKDYFWQCALYLHGLRKIQPKIDKGLLFIKNKNTANYLEYYFWLSDEDDLYVYQIDGTNIGECVYAMNKPIDRAIEKFMTIDMHKSNNTMPDRPYLYGDWHCDYCGWGKVCWQGYKDEVEQMCQYKVIPGLRDPKMLKAVTDYKKIKTAKGQLEKDEKELKKYFRETLNELKIKSFKAGDFVVSRQLRDVKEYKVEARMDEIIMVKEIKNEPEDAN